MLRAKIGRWVEGEGGSDAGADAAAFRARLANVPQGPSRQGRRTLDARRVGAQEIDIIQWVDVTHASQHDEEDEETCARREHEGDEREGSSYTNRT